MHPHGRVIEDTRISSKVSDKLNVQEGPGLDLDSGPPYLELNSVRILSDAQSVVI